MMLVSFSHFCCIDNNILCGLQSRGCSDLSSSTSAQAVHVTRMHTTAHSAHYAMASPLRAAHKRVLTEGQLSPAIRLI